MQKRKATILQMSHTHWAEIKDASAQAVSEVSSFYGENVQLFFSCFLCMLSVLGDFFPSPLLEAVVSSQFFWFVLSILGNITRMCWAGEVWFICSLQKIFSWTCLQISIAQERKFWPDLFFLFLFLLPAKKKKKKN